MNEKELAEVREMVKEMPLSIKRRFLKNSGCIDPHYIDSASEETINDMALAGLKATGYRLRKVI